MPEAMTAAASNRTAGFRNHAATASPEPRRPAVSTAVSAPGFIRFEHLSHLLARDDRCRALADTREALGQGEGPRTEHPPEQLLLALKADLLSLDDLDE